MQSTVEITLDGTEEELSALFSYSKSTQLSGLTKLETYLAHVFNQSLVRDNYFGAWAMVEQIDGKYVLKMYCAHHDLSPFIKLIPAFIEAGKEGLRIYQQYAEQILKDSKGQMRFLLPFGLSMARTKSIQLLHFPPLETFVYLDYLYSPTNRRWENLLGYNGLTEFRFPQCETIVDCVPLAAPGGDSAGIAPYNNSFTSYVLKMLDARLRASEDSILPIVAYGGPVRDWLKQAFADQIPGTLVPLSLLELKISDDLPLTPVLCANHPSKYLYYTDDTNPDDFETKKQVMTQDLIAAGWQAKMMRHPESNAQDILDEMTSHWTDNLRVLHIMEEEDKAYGYNY